MCRRQSGYESSISPDFKIFEKLCGGEDNFCGEEENLLLDFKGGKDVAAAVDPMLREAVRQKKIKSSDVERLAVKFKSWMKGVNWNKTRMSASKHLQTSSSFSVPIIVNQLLYININTTSVVTSNKSGRCVPHNCNITSCTTSCTRSVPEIVRHKLLVIVLAFHATTFSRI